ncbi:transposase domain protein [Lysobacter antibioticus]|uniref:integrase core domain-containing protein n=1 Tax=Lysobacter antibioticus TaxID=84531 RepID=UPI000720A5C2|nr:transposase domain protein [Lysobacter antibioticus]
MISIAPGKPAHNAYIESFNGKFQDERPNEKQFVSLDHAEAAIGSGAVIATR